MANSDLIRRTYMLVPSDDEILERHSEHLGDGLRCVSAN